VAFAGESLNTCVLKQMAQHFKRADFHNIYGATETNDTFVFSLKDVQNFKDDEPLPIGVPLPYVEYLIIDNKGNYGTEVSEGELLVRTPTIMRGYKNNERMTDKDFYHTKDIVRRLENGNLLFCGRTDDIIKTNGYRVNLIEIQTVLQTYDDIVEAAVIPELDEEIGYRIVAIICIKMDSQTCSIDLRNHCAKHLPRYAIPHVFDIGRTRLPKTPSGKIDKRSLIATRN
jgi:acyl-coenzyme A synthetase/AMP-(fatty) acid ligase